MGIFRRSDGNFRMSDRHISYVEKPLILSIFDKISVNLIKVSLG